MHLQDPSTKDLPKGPATDHSPTKQKEEKIDDIVKKRGTKAASTPLSPRRGHLSYAGLKGLPPLIK